MDLMTRETWVLAGEEGQQRNCIWTPDGRGILYQSTETGDRELYLRPVGGGPAVRLTRYPGEDGASRTFIPIPGGR